MRRRIPVIIAGVVFVALILASPKIWKNLNRDNPIPTPTTMQATVATSAPTTAPVATTKPTASYISVVKQAIPALAATRPLEIPLDIREAAHFVLKDPVYFDHRTSEMWITRDDAEPIGEVFKKVNSDSVHITREKVHFVHWVNTGENKPSPFLVCEGKNGLEMVSAGGRTPIAVTRKLNWSTAQSWDSQNAIVVANEDGLSILRVGKKIVEDASPALIELNKAHAPVQWLWDPKGVLAWIPPDKEKEGSKGAVRYVDGQWKKLGEEQDFPANIFHLVPLMDGSVLQLYRGEREQVEFHVAAMDALNVDEKKILELVEGLAAPDQESRDQAYLKLAKYGPGAWPIIRKAMENAIPEAQVRIAELLKAQLQPTLGGMVLVDKKLRLISRHQDGGVLFYSAKGVSIPRGEDTPLAVHPAWIWLHPGESIQLMQEETFMKMDPAKTTAVYCSGEWLFVDDQIGPQLVVGPQIRPLVTFNDRKFNVPIGCDRRGRWLFRKAEDVEGKETLVVDPTLMDVTPRLPLYELHDDHGMTTVGWDKHGWPVQTNGGSWALEERGWRAMKKEEAVFEKMEDMPPATQPSDEATTQTAATTLPAVPETYGPMLLQDPDGNRYYDGMAKLVVVKKDSSEVSWALPKRIREDQAPVLLRTPKGLLFLFNDAGRAHRIRPTPDGPQPFVLEATFSRKIPVDGIKRIWIDKAGRIDIATEIGDLFIFFPEGIIPRDIRTLMKAEELDEEDDAMQGIIRA